MWSNYQNYKSRAYVRLNFAYIGLTIRYIRLSFSDVLLGYIRLANTRPSNWFISNIRSPFVFENCLAHLSMSPASKRQLPTTLSFEPRARTYKMVSTLWPTLASYTTRGMPGRAFCYITCSDCYGSSDFRWSNAATT
jgi:hypothetical protein